MPCGVKDCLVIFFLFSFLLFSFSLLLLFLIFFLMSFIRFSFEVVLPFSFFSEFPLVFCFDLISVIFFFVVSIISRVIFFYGKFYMGEFVANKNTDNNRFFVLLFLFVVSIFFLVFSGSWLTVMIGWDGLGLTSFLLVIYYNNPSRLDSGLITVFSNRFGDCFFLLAFIFMFYAGWVSFSFFSLEISFVIVFFIILGCITKSAQLPFSSWLPYAIAAPTPVSSLVHSSTLVTAGVYLLVRFNYLLVNCFFFLSIISLMTIFLAGACAIYEIDLKKVVAISTLSQLGFIIFSLSCGFWALSFLHIVFHAFFKRCLFLSTGNLIHFILGCQDSREFGGFGSSGFSKILFIIRVLSLSGFPFSLGFYSKDTLIGGEIFFSNGVFSFIFFMSCFFTVCYRFRIIYIAFFIFPSFQSSLSFIDEVFYYFPVIVLYLFNIFIGNFFFINFLPPLFFSFYEFFLGLFIVFIGLIFFKLFPFSFFIVNFFSSISYLNFFSSSIISKNFILGNYKFDFTWSESFSALGVFYILSNFLSYVKVMFLHHYFFIYFSVIFLFVFFYF